MKKKDLKLGLGLMVIFIFLYGVSYTFGRANVSETHTTAAFFPRVVLIMAMFLTLMLIIQNLRIQDVTKGKKIAREKSRRVLISMGLSLLLVAGLTYLGTFFSISLFIIFIMLTWGVRNKLTILINAIVTPILVYLIFSKTLLVQFPTGILF